MKQTNNSGGGPQCALIGFWRILQSASGLVLRATPRLACGLSLILAISPLIGVQGQTAEESRAVGFIVHKNPLYDDNVAKVEECRKVQTFPHTLTIHTADGKEKQVLNSHFVLFHSYENLLDQPEILTSAIEALQKEKKQLKDYVEKYRAARGIGTRRIERIDAVIQKLESGQVRSGGSWIPVAQYESLVAERKRIQSEEAQRLQMVREKAQKARLAAMMEDHRAERDRREAEKLKEEQKSAAALAQQQEQQRIAMKKNAEMERRMERQIVWTRNLGRTTKGSADAFLVDNHSRILEELQRRGEQSDWKRNVAVAALDELSKLGFSLPEEVGEVGGGVVHLHRNSSGADDIAALSVTRADQIVSLDVVSFSVDGKLTSSLVRDILTVLRRSQPAETEEWYSVAYAISAIKERSGERTFLHSKGEENGVTKSFGSVHLSLKAAEDVITKEGEAGAAIWLSRW